MIPALLGALLYSRGIWNGWALDDRIDLLENRFVAGPLDLPGIFTTEYYGGWGHLTTGHYRPLLILTYKLVASAFGLVPLPFHILNVVLFALILLVTSRLVARISGDRSVGLVAACLVAVHPVFSEAVAAVAGLKELAAALLGLLSLGTWLGARESVSFGRKLPGLSSSTLSFLLLVAALLFKEMALAFVGIALAAELLHPASPRPGSLRGALLRVLSLWPLALAAALWLGLRVAVTGGLFRPWTVFSVDNPFVILPSPFRRVAAISLLPRYVGLWLWPSCLSSDYSEGSFPVPGSVSDPWVVGGIVVGVVLLGAVVLAVRRGARAVAFGLVACLLSYSLVSNVVVVIGTAMAERLFFLSAWGIAIASGALVVALARGASAFVSGARPRLWLAGTGLLLLLGPLALRTWSRLPEWRDDEALSAAAVRCHPGNVKALIQRAETVTRAGRPEEARELLERALLVRRSSSYALAEMGMHWLGLGEAARAEPYLRESVSQADPLAGPALALAHLYLAAGRNDEAAWAAERALAAGPSYSTAARAREVLGETRLARGDVAGAEQQYRLAIREDPGDPAGHFGLGRCLEARGLSDQAVEEYWLAEERAPGDPRIFVARARVLARAGRSQEALRTLERLRAARPDFESAADLEPARRLLEVLRGGP